MSANPAASAIPVATLTHDEAQLLDDYRGNTERGKMTVRVLAKGMRISGGDALAASEAEALRVLQSLQQAHATPR